MSERHEYEERVAERVYQRLRSHVVWADLPLSDDSQPVQLHQTIGYQGELRDQVRRVGEHGHSSMPVPGAKAIILYHGGTRSMGTVIGVEDPRYRPTGLKAGETQGWMVDGAGNDGSGGTTRRLWQGLLGWIHNIFGRQINIGAAADTATVVITGAAITLRGPVTIAGDLTVTGATTVQDLAIEGVETGGGAV